MKTAVILLVTWFVHDQPPQSFQQEFSSIASCQSAKSALLQEEARLKAESKRQDEYLKNPGDIVSVKTIPPSVTAVCVEQ